MADESKFPEGFFWGSSTSSYQVEGGIDNNDWAEAARKGRVPVAGRACDSYNRYEEDFDIAKSLGQNAHRFSIEWARIEPEEGKFNEEEIEHYRKVLMALRERGLEPFVTLWHFTLPIWFAKMGGFENKKAPFYFARYCEYVVSRLGEGVHPVKFTEGGAAGQQFDGAKFWITINEPMVYTGNGYSRGKWPPFKENFFRTFGVTKRLITSHNIAYKKIKAIDNRFQVGIAKHNINLESNHNPFYRLVSSLYSWFWNERFLNKIEQDFIGLNYYFHKKLGDKIEHEKSDIGWDIYPKGIYNLLIQLKKYHKPVYITENGLANSNDEKRIKFIHEHLYWVSHAIHDGADARGYFYWSLLDNFEWAEGFKPRFGIVEVNYETMERTIRPSAYEYKKICESNSLSSSG